ncbi:LuxR family transcriptional regulator OS=Streptomyces antimycoticus OX=68175 GN=SSPO_064470 PE=4 SV=1 [Streptomyces antimycoticus]
MYLVERGVQLAELADRLDPGAIGRCEFVVVSGPAGSGRSALLAASSESARKRGMRVLPVGRDGYGGTPRVDVVGAAGELVRSITGDVPAEDLGALAKQLLALTRSAPLLVVVDDVHLIDPDSYTLLRALVSAYGAETAPIAVLVSGTRHAAACQLLKELFPFFRRRRSRPIVTTPLTTVGMAELVRMRLSVEPSAVLVEELAAVTGGNVFLIQAVLDDTVAAGVTDSLVFGPVFTQAVLFGLHAPACPQLVEVAQAISVLGASCDMERLSRTVEEPRGLHRMVDGLIASGVLSDELTLHPRIRDVLLKSADGTRLPMLQSRAAEVLYDDGAPAPEVARQLLMNGSAPQPWAVAILCEAADQATRSYRYQEAVSLLQFASRWCSDHATRVEIRANLVDISWWLDPTMVSRQLRTGPRHKGRRRCPDRRVRAGIRARGSALHRARRQAQHRPGGPRTGGGHRCARAPAAPGQRRDAGVAPAVMMVVAGASSRRAWRRTTPRSVSWRPRHGERRHSAGWPRR